MSAPTLPSPSNLQIVRMDQGGVNEHIPARETKVGILRIEAASLKMPARFTSAEGKRYFVRLFSTLQLNAHFISVIARAKLDHEDIATIEAALRERMASVNDALDMAIAGAQALLRANGITSVTTYDSEPLEIVVGVLSSSGRRYLEVLGKFDQLMPLLLTLQIHEVITTQAFGVQRARAKRQVRDVATAARSFASGLRRRMNATSPGEAHDVGRRPEASGPGAAASGPATTDDSAAMVTPPAEDGALQPARAGAEAMQ
jgi:hypothetical protein